MGHNHGYFPFISRTPPPHLPPTPSAQVPSWDRLVRVQASDKRPANSASESPKHRATLQAQSSKYSAFVQGIMSTRHYWGTYRGGCGLYKNQGFDLNSPPKSFPLFGLGFPTSFPQSLLQNRKFMLHHKRFPASPLGQY